MAAPDAPRAPRPRGLPWLTGALLIITPACAAVGKVDGQLAGHRFGALRSAFFDTEVEGDVTVTSAVLSDYPYTCADLGHLLLKDADPVGGDDGQSVGQVIINLVGAADQVPSPGTFPTITALDQLDEGERGAVVVVQVLEGEGYEELAWVLADEGSVEVTAARRHLAGTFDVSTSGGLFTGEFSADPCDLPRP